MWGGDWKIRISRILGHWSCSKAPKSLSEVTPGPDGSHFSMKPSMGPAFYWEIPYSQMKVQRIQFFFLHIEPSSVIGSGPRVGDPAGSLRNMHPKSLGHPEMGWMWVKCGLGVKYRGLHHLGQKHWFFLAMVCIKMDTLHTGHRLRWPLKTLARV